MDIDILYKKNLLTRKNGSFDYNGMRIIMRASVYSEIPNELMIGHFSDVIPF